MTTQTFTIPNISCGHCTSAIQKELVRLEGVGHIAGDPERKTVTVTWEPPATEAAIRDTLKEINYPAQG
jgi:copper chaperone CopZ